MNHDSKLLELITAATEQFESDTDRVCIEQTFALSLHRFEQPYIDLYKRPITSVESITYIDSDGDEQTVDADVYKLSKARRQIQLNGGQQWPSTYFSGPDSVVVTFTAGVTEPKQVSRLYVQAISLLVGAWFLDPADEAQRDPWRTAYHRLLMKLQQEKQV